MEALRAITRGDLPPVGSPISLSRSICEELLAFLGYIPNWVDSGTAALALALLAAKANRPDLLAPEVIVPAYCCPDLIAAAKFAGVDPVVVDILPNDPRYDIALLKQALGANTLAVIAVNFLGIREDISTIKDLLTAWPQTYLIEDNAQWFPAAEENHLLAGDFVIFSFGRGKPVSLLGGGLLLSKQPLPILASEMVLPAETRALLSVIKIGLYNILLIPQFYQLLNRNPFIKLGETHFDSLHCIRKLSNDKMTLIAQNVINYRKRDQSLKREYGKVFAQSGVENLLASAIESRGRRLLRFPVLLSTEDQKNSLLEKFSQQGLGATAMYKTPVIEIEGVEKSVTKSFLNGSAHSFARRFLTLPIHEHVSPKHLKAIEDIIALGLHKNL